MNDNFNFTLSGRLFELSYSENALSLEEFFEFAANNGFKSVELRDSQIGIDSSFATIDKVNMLSVKYGISVALITARKGRLDSEEGYEIYKKYLDLAANLSCGQIKISGKDIALVRKAASDAENFNIKIGTNNHIGTPLATIKGSMEWFKKIKHPNYYLHFDPSHLWLSGETNIDEFIEEMIERISYTIIQDYVETEEGALCGIRHVTPITVGEIGFVGYSQIIKKLVSMNFKEPFALVYLKDAINLDMKEHKLKHHIMKYFEEVMT